jgi:excisionase family DNA binding protein
MSTINGLLNVKEAADYLGYMPSTMYQLRYEKKVGGQKEGKNVYFTREELDAYKAQYAFLNPEEPPLEIPPEPAGEETLPDVKNAPLSDILVAVNTLVEQQVAKQMKEERARLACLVTDIRKIQQMMNSTIDSILSEYE